MEKAVFVGRFQPLHNGHVNAIRNIIEQDDIDHLHIIIGSADKKDTDSNPLSFETRKDIISKSLQNLIENRQISISGLDDCTDDDEWIKNLRQIAPDATVAYSGNGWTRRCMEPFCKVEDPDFLDKEILNGTNIRLRIKEKKEIKHLVPVKVFEILSKDRYK
ncbi:MAG: adenylyltransferase/cytidyltransferase family protein [Nanohaloarchaea archaeon]|nr:adenylyltransferase/cytidyltransferase family protein [Candidatus Nanohaloarchaea archaeon]